MAGKKEKKKPKEAEAEAAIPAPEGEEGAPAKKKLSGKTLILFIVLPAILVLGGGGATAMMLLGGKKEAAADEPAGDHAIPEEGAEGDAHGAKPKKADKGKEKKDDHGKAAGGKEGDHGPAGAEGGGMDVGSLIPGEDGGPSYYNMPGLIVNLSGKDNGRPLVLKLDLILEAGQEGSFENVPGLMPRLQDQIQTFLRELRVEDLDGSAGTYRLRLELLKRFNLVLAPQKIDAVLIEGILVQ
jgi:flagellar FliL protein